MLNFRTPFTLILIMLGPFVHAQEESLVIPDTTRVAEIVAPDSTFVPDSTAVQDTTLVKGSRKPSGLQGPVVYEAQIIDNLLQERKTILTGRAKVNYTNMTLTAAKITVEWDQDQMLAEGRLDSVWMQIDDLNGDEEPDSVKVAKMVETPKFVEAGDEIHGETMLFNFKTRKGRVLRGRTAFEDGFYSGNAMKLVKEKTLNVADASFTTCDKEENPHFHFQSKKMKIEVNKKVIAKPIIMYLGNIPVGALPFLYFPIQKGRQSGILFPKYGVSELEGQYLRGLGYYWAASEYWDVKGMVDYFEKAGFMLRGNFRYNVKYKMSGSVAGSWTRKNFEVNDRQERRWDLAVRHNQTLSPTMNLTVDGRFVSSGNFYQDVSANREQRLQQELRSNAKLSKKFGSSGRLEVILKQTRNLETDITEETLPKITLANRWSNLIPKPRSIKGADKEDKWYNAFTVPYSFNLLGESGTELDRTAGEPTVIDKKGAGLDQKLSIYIAPKLFGWLSMSPKISYRESWFSERYTYELDPETNSVEKRATMGFFTRRTYDASVSMNTKIYGIFQTRHLENVMVRHVATPTISFSYRPDFSEDRYGYYQTVEDTLGEENTYDRFYGSIFGSTGRGRSKAVSLSLQNLFQMRIGEGEDAKKFDLFNWRLSTSYNWEASQYKLNDLSSMLQAKPVNNVSMNFRTTYSFYQNNDAGQKIDRLFVDDVDFSSVKGFLSSKWMRLTNLSATLDLRLKGHAKTGGGGSGKEKGEEVEGEGEGEEDDIRIEEEAVLGIEDRLDPADRLGGLDVPWSMNMNVSYTENRYSPLSTTKKFWARANLEFTLTKNWKISYQAQWDLLEGKAVSQDLVFHRDLHCWEAQIAWTPTGYNKRFYFKINVKSSMLRDLKFEKGSGRSGFTSSGLSGMY